MPHGNEDTSSDMTLARILTETNGDFFSRANIKYFRLSAGGKHELSCFLHTPICGEILTHNAHHPEKSLQIPPLCPQGIHDQLRLPTRQSSPNTSNSTPVGPPFQKSAIFGFFVSRGTIHRNPSSPSRIGRETRFPASAKGLGLQRRGWILQI